MGIRSFFHKIRIGFIRRREPAIPYIDEAKRYGNKGEDTFVGMLRRELPGCKVKRNIIINTPEGNAEIDCLVLYHNKLFAIEVKRWKGSIFETENGFLQMKTDRWTEDFHSKYLKSPFKQLGRAIYLLRKQIPVKAWVNGIVFFEDDELESVIVKSDHIWFSHYRDLANYIRGFGNESCGTSATEFFQMCFTADCLYAKAWENTKYCIIDRQTLRFETNKGFVDPGRIKAIHIYHHWSYDDLLIKMKDGTEEIASLENAKIRVIDNGYCKAYALCKLDEITLGGTIELQ